MTRKEKIDEIESMILEVGSKISKNGNEPIVDGVSKKYFTSSPRILWLLKEPYDTRDEYGEAKDGGGFTIDLPSIGFTETKTGMNMAYVTYGIRNNLFMKDMPDIKNEPLIVKSLETTGMINMSKMPNKSKTNSTELRYKFDNWKEIVLKQLSVYKPDIVICGNTFWMLVNNSEIGPITPENYVIEKDNFDCYLKDGVYYVSAYHPAQTRLTTKVYCDTIIELVQDLVMRLKK